MSLGATLASKGGLDIKDLGKLLKPGGHLELENVNAADMLWNFKLPGLMNSSIAVSPDGTIYAGCDDNRLYAVKDGKKLWEYDTGTWVRAQVSLGPDGTVFTGGGKTIHAVKDGKKLWDFSLEPRFQRGCDRDFSGSIEYIKAGPDGTVYMGDDYGTIYALKDGKKLWSKETDGSCDYACAPDPVPGTDGLVYSGSYRRTLYAFKDGEVAWEAKNMGSNLLAGKDGVIYSTGGYPDSLYAMKDGVEVWKFPIGGILLSPPIQGPDGTLYCAVNPPLDDRKGIATVFAIKDGAMQWRAKIKGHFESSPLLAQDGTVLVSSEKRIIAVKDGLPVWGFGDNDHYFRASPVQGEDGTFFAASHDGTIYALRDPYTEESLGQVIEEALSKREEAESLEIAEGWIMVGDVRMPIAGEKKKSTQES